MNIDGTNTLLPEADRRGRRRGPHLPAAAPAGGQGPGPRPHRPVHAAGVDRAVAAGRDAAAADQGTAAEPGRTRQARRAVGVHPVLLLHDVVPELLVERRPLSRPGGAAAGLSTDRP